MSVPMGSDMGDMPLRGNSILPKQRKSRKVKGRVSSLQRVWNQVPNTPPYEFKLMINALMLIANLAGAIILVAWAVMEPIK